MLDVIRLPVKTPGWVVLLVFAVGGWVALFLAGMFPAGFELVAVGLMSGLWYGLAGLLQCHGQHLFRAAANGHVMPPAPVPSAFNPVSAVVASVLILAWASASLIRAAVFSDNPLIWCGAAVALAIAPASAALIMLGDSAIEGGDPRRIAQFVRGLGPAYPVFCAAPWIGYGAILSTLWYCERAVAVVLLLAGYVYLLMQYFAGRIVFMRRNQLALATQRSPEQDVAAEAATQEAALKMLLIELHRLCGVDRYREAYARLDSFLARDQYRNDARAHTVLRDFQGRPLALEHACHYIDRLIAARKSLRAWEICKRCLDEDAAFRPLSDRSALSLAGLAGHADAHYAATLLRDFARAYPKSPLQGSAMLRLAQIEIEHLGDRRG